MNHTKPIRLFVDAHVFDDGYQGSRTFIHELYRIICKKEDIALYLGAYDIKNLGAQFDHCDRIHYVPYKKKTGPGRLLFDIPAIIKKHGIDYAHFQYIVPLKKNCRFIVTTHDVIFNEQPQHFSWFYRKMKTWLFRRGAHKADILTTVSPHSKNSIEKHLGVDAGKINVLPNGVNAAFFQPYSKANSKRYIKDRFGFDQFILCVSRFEPRKNHLLLLEAYLDLELFRKGYFLVLPGSQSLATPAFDAVLNRLPEATRAFIHIEPGISDNDLLELYRSADLFVYPSKAEGFGIPPLEAAAAKIPVLCSDSTAMTDFDFFAEGLFDPGDIAQFKTKLWACLTHPPSIKALESIAGAVEQRYNWKRTAEQFYQLIKNDHVKFTS